MEEIERHGRRRTQPYAREVEPTHGVHRSQMERGGRHAVSDRRYGV
ncbi:putative endonuclease VII [Streptomyces hygroscopicus subsp. jinggangensis 5008]|nr:putative endonuclease VII [Streptomyces hygroscopicus subsp. jinggangensis 5008]AGF60576.1 putative endonuclease VII [Streptomyces hygroscopicus subsp. jinggangensis TL01]